MTDSITAAPATVARPHIELSRGGPEKPWLGQLVPVEVDIWRPEPDESHPLEPFALDDVVAAGMIVKWDEHASPPDIKQQGETRFLVQHRALLVFPESEGELSLPPIVARWTDPATKTEVVVSSSELRFQAALPRGAGDPLPLVASSVALVQTFDRDLSELRVGDGFTRTLSLHATDTYPVVFPELQLAEVPGLRAYPAQPKASSNSEHGQIQGDLTLKVTYVVERVGPHGMPGTALRWLEPSSGRYAVAAVPEISFWARPNWSLGFQCFGIQRSAAVATEVGSLALFALLVLAVVRRLRRGPSRFERALALRSRELRAFRAAVQAARRGSALDTLRSIYTWLVIRLPSRLDRTLAPLASATQESGIGCAKLEADIFRNRVSAAPGAEFGFMLRRARKALGRAQPTGALDGLNSVQTDQGGR